VRVPVARAVAAAALLVPLPCRVTVPAVLQLGDASRIYVAVPGTLQWAIKPGAAVQRGDPVGRLASDDLQVQLARLRGELSVRESELESLRRRGQQQANRGESGASSEVPTARKALADVRQRLQKRMDEYDRLTLRTPVTGRVVSPPRRERPSGGEQLAEWSGNPLDPVNLGAYLAEGTLFCLVGDRQTMEVLLVIRESDLDLLSIGQRVRVQLDQHPGRYLDGQISEMSQVDLQSPPPELIASGMLPIRARQRGGGPLVGSYYQAKVSLADCPRDLLPGAVGRAKIYVAPRSLGRRILHYLSDTFRFRL